MSAAEQYDTREAWLAARRNSIGASEASAVVGMNSYQSAYSLWYDKTEPPPPQEMDEIARWGLLLEPAILDEFARQTNLSVAKFPEYTITRDQKRHYLSCTFDAFTDNRPIQLKTAHFSAAKVWRTEVPMPYLVQCQIEIHIAEADYAYIAVLADGYQFQWHKINRHQKFIDRLLKRIDHFWNEYVVKRQPPPTDYHAATTAALNRRYPASNGKAIELPAELQAMYEEHEELTKQESAAKKRKAEISNAIKERMGEHEYASFGGNEGWKWGGPEGQRRFTRSKRCPEPVSAN